MLFKNKFQDLKDSACTWTFFEDSMTVHWDTKCGNTFQFMDGSITDNNFVFCPYCGNGITEVDE